LRLILTFRRLKETYISVKKIEWLDEQRLFCVFEIGNKGTGVYSNELQKIILKPGAYYDFEIDYKMRHINFKKSVYSDKYTMMNYEGEEILYP
jgi:hypothetical protein